MTLLACVIGLGAALSKANGNSPPAPSPAPIDATLKARILSMMDQTKDPWFVFLLLCLTEFVFVLSDDFYAYACGGFKFQATSQQVFHSAPQAPHSRACVCVCSPIIRRLSARSATTPPLSKWRSCSTATRCCPLSSTDADRPPMQAKWRSVFVLCCCLFLFCYCLVWFDLLSFVQVASLKPWFALVNTIQTPLGTLCVVIAISFVCAPCSFVFVVAPS